MKTKKIVIVLLCAATFFAFSCSKEEPQGPAGPQGEQYDEAIVIGIQINTYTYRSSTPVSNTVWQNMTELEQAQTHPDVDFPTFRQ